MRTPGQIIQGLIKDFHTTQGAVAFHMAYHPQHVHKVCTDQRTPSALFVVKFAEALGIEPEPLWRAVSEYQLHLARREITHERKRRETWAAEALELRETV